MEVEKKTLYRQVADMGKEVGVTALPTAMLPDALFTILLEMAARIESLQEQVDELRGQK